MCSVLPRRKVVNSIAIQKKVYSDYTFEELISGTVGNIDVVNDIFEHIEVLVDGPFIEEKKNLRLKFRGSENQRVIDIKGTRLKKDIVQEISL